MVRVSVIVPVYNVEQYLEQCIRSIITQTEENIEIILVNDGSTDDSGRICQDFESKDSRITYVKTENHGVSHARNTGMARATGEWLCFVDADDYLPKDALENLLAVSDDADIVVGNAYIDKIGSILHDCYSTSASLKKTQAVLIGNILRCPYYKQNGKESNLASVWGKLFRRTFCKEKRLQFPPVGYMEDGIFNLCAVQNTEPDRILFTDCYAYYYRMRDGSTLHSPMPHFEDMAGQILSCLSESLEKSGDQEERDIFLYQKMHLLIDHVRFAYMHKDCPLSWREKARELQRLAEVYEIEEISATIDKRLLTKNQRILTRLVTAGAYNTTLIFFYLKGYVSLIRAGGGFS